MTLLKYFLSTGLNASESDSDCFRISPSYDTFLRCSTAAVVLTLLRTEMQLSVKEATTVFLY